MNVAVLPSQARRTIAIADTALQWSSRFWFSATFIGQLAFVAYITMFYGGAVARGDLSEWNAVLPRGYVAGDSLGNLSTFVHLLFAAVITLAGLLQLIPAVRSGAPRFHRWSGRFYMLSAALLSITGLYLVWVRGSVGDLSQHIGISINAVLILLCGALAWKRARARRFMQHREWAIRLFLVVSGVWFFRVSLMFWILANGGPVGFDPQTFSGPALTVIAISQYAVPLAVAELYFRARRRGEAARQFAVAALLTVLTIMMSIGIFGAIAGLWLPRMGGAG